MKNLESPGKTGRIGRYELPNSALNRRWNILEDFKTLCSVFFFQSFCQPCKHSIHPIQPLKKSVRESTKEKFHADTPCTTGALDDFDAMLLNK